MDLEGFRWRNLQALSTPASHTLEPVHPPRAPHPSPTRPAPAVQAWEAWVEPPDMGEALPGPTATGRPREAGGVRAPDAVALEAALATPPRGPDARAMSRWCRVKCAWLVARLANDARLRIKIGRIGAVRPLVHLLAQVRGCVMPHTLAKRCAWKPTLAPG